MPDGAERLARLARAWDQAAVGYERYFVPRFAPWVASAVEYLATAPLPPGPVAVPCCGTFPELPVLRTRYAEREVVGVDLSAGMVRLARERAAHDRDVRVVEGDATELRRWCPDGCAGVVSVFGLQQLPDPGAALGSWTDTLLPGGRLSVMYWPGRPEDRGPFTLLDTVLSATRPTGDEPWQTRLGRAVTDAGGTVEHDEYRAHPMEHPSAAAFWDAMADDGPLRGLARARGPAFMRSARDEFVRRAPAGPWRHRPRARHVVAHRAVAGRSGVAG